MSKGGSRNNAGRKKGGKNKSSLDAIYAARNSGSGELPHEFLLRVARGEKIDGYQPNFEQRLDAAKAAANYFSPKLAQVEQKMEAKVQTVVKGEPLTADEWASIFCKE